MSLDVSLRLRLQNQLSRESKTAERDLKELRDTAQKLGSANGADRLKANLRELGNTAARQKKPLVDLGHAAKNLNSINVSRGAQSIRSLGDASEATRKRVDNLVKKTREIDRIDHSKFSRVNDSAGRLNQTMGWLAATASGAFAGLLAFASVDNIMRGLEQLSGKFRDLNREVASVAVTAEQRTPEAIARISQSNERLSIRHGMTQTEVNNSRKVYAAAGIDLGSQEQILDPTLKGAKAEDTSGETMASAMVAAKQNLGVKDSEVTAAIDMMAKGAKLGMFEVKDMAKNFPSLGAMMAGTGREGLQGWAELIAMSQVVNMSAGSPDDAATNLRNLLGKLTSRDTVENFKNKGVDLDSLKQKSEREGKSYPMAVLDTVMKLTGGNEFQINELFGDQQAGLALKPLIGKRAIYEQFLKEILEESAGTVDADYRFLKTTPKERADRRAAAWEATGNAIGEKYNIASEPYIDRAVRLVNPAYDRIRTIEEEGDLLKRTGQERLQIENEILRLQGQQRDMAGGGQELGPLLNRLRAQLESLNEEEEAIIERARRAKASEGEFAPPITLDGEAVTRTGQIPVPAARPGPLPVPRPSDMSGAADSAMEGYNASLGQGLDRAVNMSAEKAAEMQRLLNFTAQPTIQPNFLPPAGVPASPAPGKQSSISPTNTFNQTITSPNAKHAAVQSAREIRRAQARTLYDTGRRLA